jgi:integrase
MVPPTTNGELPFSGFSKAMAALNVAIVELRAADKRKPMPPWVLHDLRRTAWSLMSRAGVTSDIAERVLGHVIPACAASMTGTSISLRSGMRWSGWLGSWILDSPGSDVVPLRAS